MSIASLKKEQVKAILSEKGIDTPYEAVNEELTASKGYSCCRNTYYDAKAELKRHSRYEMDVPDGKPHTMAGAVDLYLDGRKELEGPILASPDGEPQPDHWSGFLKFVFAVESVGGVAKARKLLDQIEQLQSTLKGVPE